MKKPWGSSSTLLVTRGQTALRLSRGGCPPRAAALRHRETTGGEGGGKGGGVGNVIVKLAF